MLAESNRPPVSSELPAQTPVLGTDSSYRARATATDRVLQVLQRRKWAIATTALAAASGIWAWTLTRPYIYEGQMQLLPTDAELAEGQSGLEPVLLESAAVLGSTVEALRSAYPGLTYQSLSRNLSAIAQERSLAVRYLGASPAEVEAVLQEVAQQYQAISGEAVTLTVPTVSDRPVSPNILKGLLLGAIAGLSLGAVVGLIAEKLDRSFHSPDNLKAFTKLPMVGIIPFFKTLQPLKPGRFAPPRNPAIAGLANYEAASFLEAFRSLYSNLRFLKTDRPLRSLVISSAIPAEGKSTTALNLAKAAAVMGQRVLLVDADLRLPQLHTRLQLPNQMGLSEVLGQQLPWREHLRSALDENLQVLTAGSAPADPVRLLSSPAMRTLMHEFAEAFDLVIYDMPPLLGFTDSGLVASQTDGMVLVVGLGTTTRMELKQALDSLEVMPVQVLGMVANGIRSHTTQAYSYDRYHRYYAQRAMVSAIESNLGLTPPLPAALVAATPTDARLEEPAEVAIASESAESPEPQSAEVDEVDAVATIDDTELLELSLEEETELEPIDQAPLEFEAEPALGESFPTVEHDADAVPVEAHADAVFPEVNDTTVPPRLNESDAERANSAPPLFSQLVAEMKELMHIYAVMPQLLQQAAQAQRDDEDDPKAVTSNAMDEDWYGQMDEDWYGQAAVEPNALDKELADDRPAQLSLDTETTNVPDFLDQSTVEAIAQHTDEGSTDQSPIQDDLNPEPYYEELTLDRLTPSVTDDEVRDQVTPLDERPLGQPWSVLDAFLGAQEDRDAAAQDFIPHPADDEAAFATPLVEPTLAAPISNESADLSEQTEVGDRPTFDTVEIIDSPELSEDEVEQLEEQGILSSLALPDGSVLEEKAEDNAENTLILISVSDNALSDFSDEVDPLLEDELEDASLDADPVLDMAARPDVSALEQNGRSALPEEPSFVDVVHNQALTDTSVDFPKYQDEESWDIEDEFLGDSPAELEEQELEELLSWDSPVISQAVSNQFERAVLAAQDAIHIGETVATPEDWLILSTRWQQAAELMASVPTDDPNFDIAQRCQALYQSNSEYAYQRARYEADLDV